ncbi:MAG: (d)CMP kinase [Planctomycetota bacterium]
MITVDGPAAAGKSTVARTLARRLGFHYLDSGAMYRAATWKALEEGVKMEEAEALARVVADCEIRLRPGQDGARVICDGRDVTDEIRRPRITEKIHHLADEPEVRRRLIEQQRRFARGRDVVAEGRDQGTEVFPDAEVKFYLDASVPARARRRIQDLRRAGEDLSVAEVQQQVRERDRRDRSRPMGALRVQEDMIRIDSTDMSVDEVVRRMVEEIKRRTDLHTRSGQEAGA